MAACPWELAGLEPRLDRRRACGAGSDSSTAFAAMTANSIRRDATHFAQLMQR